MDNKNENLEIKKIFVNASVSKAKGQVHIKAPKTKDVENLTEILRNDCAAVVSVENIDDNNINIRLNSLTLEMLRKDSRFSALKEFVDEKLEQQLSI